MDVRCIVQSSATFKSSCGSPFTVQSIFIFDMNLYQIYKESTKVRIDEPLTGHSHIENVMLFKHRLAIIMLNYSSTRIYIAERDNTIISTINIECEFRSYGSINDEELFYLLPQLGQWGALNVFTLEQRRGRF